MSPNQRRQPQGFADDDVRTQQYVCWSRMHAEAGQALSAIIQRKEIERRAGEGLFFWGVGNAPSIVVGALARLQQPVEVVFSIMKSRPRSADLNPSRTFVWRRYIGQDGGVRPLPPHVLVTSRADSATGPKTRHFALMCWSDRPLSIEYGRPFDPSSFLNAGGAGAPVGASQVTALLRRTSRGTSRTDYEANLRAWLVGDYWVRLADPVECSFGFDHLDVFSDETSADWLEFVRHSRLSGDHFSPSVGSQGMLL